MQDTKNQAFKEYLETLRLSPRTIQGYLCYLPYFPTNITENTIQQFIRQHNNTVARSSLKNYLQWQKIKIDIPKIRGRKGRKILNYLTREEIQKLIENTPNIRYAILIQALFETGCRISEALDWTPLNIDFKNLTISGKGKGNKPYIVNISQDTADALAALSENLLDEKEHLFPINRDRALKYIKKQGQRILGKKIGTHTLRHSCAMELRRKGMPIENIKEYLRHENISTTQIYAHAENQQEVLQQAKKILTS